MRVQLTDPEKMGDGLQTAYVTYLLITTEFNPNPSPSGVRRRYGDFHDLYKKLTSLSYNSTTSVPLLIPGLPSKHRLAYLDRFSVEFIEKRRLALEIWINRVAQKLLKSEDVDSEEKYGREKSELLRQFLFNPDPHWHSSLDTGHSRSQTTDSHLETSTTPVPAATTGGTIVKKLDSLGDKLLTTLSLATSSKRPRQTTPILTDILDLVQLYEENLTALEKEVLSIVKLLGAMSDDYLELSGILTPLYREHQLRTSNFQNPERQEVEDGEMKNFAGGISDAFQTLHQLLSHDLLQTYIPLHTSYCSNVRALVKQCEEKIVESEQVRTWLGEALKERERVLTGGDVPTSASSSTTGMMDRVKAFIRNDNSSNPNPSTVASSGSTDPELIRTQHLHSLDTSITSLKTSLDSLTKQSSSMISGLKSEVEEWQGTVKREDLRRAVRDLVKAQVECWRACLLEVDAADKELAVNE